MIRSDEKMNISINIDGKSLFNMIAWFLYNGFFGVSGILLLWMAHFNIINNEMNISCFIFGLLMIGYTSIQSMNTFDVNYYALIKKAIM